VLLESLEGISLKVKGGIEEDGFDNCDDCS
jgi:hypothetical protein